MKNLNFTQFSFMLFSWLFFINCQANSLLQSEHSKQCKYYFDQAEYKQALLPCTNAANENNPMSQTLLGEILDGGLAGSVEREQAEQWWLKAASKNYLQAENLLALKYYYGGTLFEKQAHWKQDYHKAMKFWMKGAKRDIPSSQYMIGIMHQLGQGTEIDLVEAIAWFKLALNGNYKMASDSIHEISKQMSASEQEQGHQRYLNYLNQYSSKKSKSLLSL